MLSQDEQWLLQEKYDGVETPEFLADCERLAAGEPLGYVIGHVPFLNCTMYLDSKPLIPRPETEYWTEQAIAAAREAGAALPRPLRVFDLCAGSGAIGVAVAKALPEAHITFAELEPTHLPTIEKNLRENGIVSKHFDIYTGNLFAALPPNTAPSDIILCNPPYIDPALDRAEPSVKDHEPHLALYGGEAGLELIARIIAEAPTHLTDGGQLWLEHEPEQAAAIATLAEKNGFQCDTRDDQYHTARYSILTRTVSQ